MGLNVYACKAYTFRSPASHVSSRVENPDTKLVTLTSAVQKPEAVRNADMAAWIRESTHDPLKIQTDLISSSRKRDICVNHIQESHR